MKLKIKDFFLNIKKYIHPDKSPFIIGITGGSGSGKSFVAERIAREFNAAIIKMDDYYIRGICKDNKDVPEALNLELINKNLKSLHENKEITKPVYTFALKKDYTEKIKLHKIIILDGLFSLNEKFIHEIDFKIFVDAKEEIRFKRRLARDQRERGYTREHTEKRWKETVQPMFKIYVLPQKAKADLIIDSNENISQAEQQLKSQ